MDGNRRITLRIPIGNVQSAEEETRHIPVRVTRRLTDVLRSTPPRAVELRDHMDPFSLPENQFSMNFALPKFLVKTLIEEVSPFLEPDPSTLIPPHIKVLCALQFFRNGPVQVSEGQHFDLGLSQPSVSCCIEEVVKVMNEQLLTKHMRFPFTQEQREAIISKNFRATSLPGVLGFVDSTHVTIREPSKHEWLFVNRHGTHSMNCQITCDSDLIILNVNARFPGETEDSWVWAVSALRRQMKKIFRKGETCWLLGDSAYPHEPWLHIPLPASAPMNAREKRYTDLHCSARISVEHCIAVLKGRFLCLSRLANLDYTPVLAGQTVNACSVLHNICVRAGLPDPELLYDAVDVDDLDNDAKSDDDDDIVNDEFSQQIRDEEIALRTEGETVRHQYLIAPCNPAGAGEE